MKLTPFADEGDASRISIERYDLLESRYLTTGDFSALQQMNTEYPMQTRMLIEDMLQLGEVNDPDINNRLLNFYQDSLLQILIQDTENHYANMADINRNLDKSFRKLEKLLPGIERPVVYTQIGALNQSVLIGERLIGISLDKYLGADYPLYQRYYEENQRQTMTRDYIVPDCMVFYVLSQYPLSRYDERSLQERELHMAKVMWVANKSLGSSFFKRPYIDAVDEYLSDHKGLSVEELMEADDYDSLLKYVAE
ncbi:MAG: gliding motility protein GldB [Prevotella sp.]|nr:gliding motility protein GldB [Prevotella sp.]